ncbi:MAG: LpqB family beta-propeller domain-containing protein [Gordonia sp. (in: high G+C Gram-positive bacteria)]|uniref:LpqB family beta-propeller domain-containing protein n=1 Tax=Gordonia sp. (in: high G+C Gram-positive bacteria) TaxID=84139 RepID=UPI003C795DE4
MKRVTVLVAWLLSAALVLTGCVDIPVSSPPQPLQAFDRKRPTNIVPAPRRGDDPETVARNLLKAMSDPTAGHRSARKFLTAGASQRWDDQGDLTIVRDVGVVIDERTETAVRLRVSATKTGVLSPDGSLRPAAGPEIIALSLTRENGSWRINGDMHPGAVTDTSQFLTAYRQADLFFPDRTLTRLIADPRWFFGAEPDASVLVNRLLGGPSSGLEGAVALGAARGATLTGPATTSGDTVSIPLGNVGDADQRHRTMLAAQIVWTLDYAGISGTYRITADGAPLVAGREAGWRPADVSAVEPDSAPRSADSVHLVRDGALTRLTGNRAVPVGGELGAGHDVESAAVSADLTRVAAVVVRDGQRTLMVGPYGGTPVAAVTGTSMTEPTFGTDADSGYVVVDGRPMQWVYDQASGTARSIPVDASAVAAVAPGPITDLRVSPDGVRVALVVGGRTMLAVISVNDVGAGSLTGVYPLTPGADGAAVGVAWATAKTLYVARLAVDVPVWKTSIVGTQPIELVSGNLKPPVVDIAASPTAVYVSDSRGVQQLGTAQVRPDQYWTAVGPDAGPGTVPVIPGA